MAAYGYISHSELQHHGILGQKWGVRRYQNADGSLTAAGKQRYYTSSLNKNGYHNIAGAVTNKGTISVGVKRSPSVNNPFPAKGTGGSIRDNNEILKKQVNTDGYHNLAGIVTKKNGYTGIGVKIDKNLKRIPRKRLSPEAKKKIAIGAIAAIGTAAVVGGTIVALKNPEATKAVLSKIGNTALSGFKTAGSKASQAVTTIKSNHDLNVANKLQKAINGTGNLVKDAKTVGRYGSPALVKAFVEKNPTALQGSVKATNALKPALTQMGDWGKKVITDAATMEKAKDNLTKAVRENYGLGAIGKTVGSATVLTGSLVAGKKIFTDLNSVYETKNLPVVKDYLNSPNGKSTKATMDKVHESIFGKPVEELEKDKKKG